MGEWYKLVPKGDPVLNLSYRKDILLRAKKDEGFRRDVVYVCGQDPVFYFNTFLYVHEHRTRAGGPRTFPFCTYPFQDDAIGEIVRCVLSGEDLVIGKSRDMGVSWICMGVIDWFWRFKAGFKGLVLSRTEMLVDQPGNPDSLFWKIDFLQKNLPRWMPPGREYSRAKKVKENRVSGSSVTGEATSAAAGVGGRATVAFLDEFSRAAENKPGLDYEMWAGTADTADCRIVNFTIKGTANMAYQLWAGEKFKDINRLRLHWIEHPRKNPGAYTVNRETGQVTLLSQTPRGQPIAPYRGIEHYEFRTDGKFPFGSPWFDRERERRGNDRDVAEMLEIDAQGSRYSFFEVQDLAEYKRTHCLEPFSVGNLLPVEGERREIEWEEGEGGSWSRWVHTDSAGKPPPGTYVLGADVSGGSGASNSCLSAVNVKTKEKVLSFVSPVVRPERFAVLAYAASVWLADLKGVKAKIIWENLGPGQQFGKRLLELGARVYRDKPDTPGSRPSGQIGWNPGEKRKFLLLDEYRAALVGGQIINYDALAVDECQFFVHDGSGNVRHEGERGQRDPSGARQNHGDRVIADALAWKLAREVGGSPEIEEKPELDCFSVAGRMEIAREQAQEARRWGMR